MQSIDRLVEKIGQKNSCVCVGLDPRFAQIPEEIKEPFRKELGESLESLAQVILNFNQEVLAIIEPYAPAVKLQISFYEQYGIPGLKSLVESIKIAREMGFEIILDAKRNDIASTAQAYARGYLGHVDVWGRQEKSYDLDSLTINPYLGSDGIRPFMEVAQEHEKGLWVLLKTSNPSAGELQDLRLSTGELVYENLARQLAELGQDWIGASGYSNLGMVVGATYPESAAKLRQMLPQTFFLIPGYGAQGASARDLLPFFHPDGLGGLVNSSRGIIFAPREQKTDYRIAVRDAVKAMRSEINHWRGLL